MRVLSLFDGISCGMVALERAGIPVEAYDAFEIDQYAVKVSEKNYPQIRHHGNVFEGDFRKFKGYDLLLGGCEYDIPIAVEVKHGCLNRMALITAIGDSVNRMIPPLIVTKKQIDELMLIMRASIEDAAAKYVSK